MPDAPNGESNSHPIHKEFCINGSALIAQSVTVRAEYAEYPDTCTKRPLDTDVYADGTTSTEFDAGIVALTERGSGG